jgi:3-oxoacyl-[acyl-carrier protein] reductase
MIDLKGKIVLVTGASRGIGAVIAATVARAGADVVVHYGNERAGAESVAASIGADHSRIVQADLTEPGAGARLWAGAVAWKGRVDVLVNNAAVALTSGVDDETGVWSATWQRTLQVNVVAVADLCREAIRHFRERRGTNAQLAGAGAAAQGTGIIINIASRAAFRGDEPDYMQYAASKGAVVALTKSIARGFARDGIVAYGIAPGWVETAMARPAVQAKGMAALTRDIPMGAMAPPEDVANVVAFLASGLARHATGTTIDVNGASYVR